MKRFNFTDFIFLSLMSISFSMHGMDPEIKEQIDQAQKTSLFKELMVQFESDSEKIYEFEGVCYKKNNFGDIFPLWQEIPQEKLTQQLSNYINFVRHSKGIPCIIEVPYNRAEVIDDIKSANFTLHYADNEKMEWIFKNYSTIPAPYTAVIGTEVIVKKNDSVLVIEEKTRQGFLGFPGGTAELKELSRETAARELEEEVNLKINPSELKLFAIINRVQVNRFDANGVNYYYMIDHSRVEGELKPDNNEVLRAFYAPLQDIAEERSIQELKVFPAVAALAKHLMAEEPRSYSQSFLDYRQLSKNETDRNLNDTMTIEFFAH